MIPMIPMISTTTTPTDACAPAWLRDLRLGYGTGQPERCGCWLVALQLYSNADASWTGKASTVDPVLGFICAAVNDCYGIDECDARTAVIRQFGVLRPLGTKAGLQASRRRAVYLTDICVRRWIPHWCMMNGDRAYADIFLNQRPIEYISQAATLSVALAGTAAGKYVDDLYGIAEGSPAKIGMQLGCIIWKTAIACMQAYSLPVAEAAAARDKFIVEQVLPALATAIDKEKHATSVCAEPACGSAEFYRLLNLEKKSGKA